MFFHLWGRYGIMSADIIPAPVRRPTTGRTSSLANRVHAPQGNMSGGHGIMSADIIPAPVRRPTKGRTSSLANRVHAPQGNMSGGHGIISSDIIPALICVRPEGGQFLWQIMRMPRRETWTKDMV